MMKVVLYLTCGDVVEINNVISINNRNGKYYLRWNYTTDNGTRTSSYNWDESEIDHLFSTWGVTDDEI